MAPAWSKEFLDIQASIECRFTLKLVRDMIITYIPNIFIFSMFIYKGCLNITRVKKLFFATAALNARLTIFFLFAKNNFSPNLKISNFINTTVYQQLHFCLFLLIPRQCQEVFCSFLKTGNQFQTIVFSEMTI